MQRSTVTRFVVWTVAIACLVTAPLAAQDPTARLIPEPPVKGDPVAPTGGIGGELTGGPDDFGYTFIDSNEPDGPAFSFVDISGSGTPVLLADDGEQSVPIGFSFPFYTGSFTDVFVVSNGFLSFDGGAGASFTNECPFNGTDMNVIAPYWDDLDPGDDGAAVFHETFASCPVGGAEGVSGEGAGQCFIAQWEEFDFFPGDGAPGGTAGTFQVVLFEDGTILTQYEGGPGLDGSSATVGISNDGAGNSLLYQCDSGGIAANLAIEFGMGPNGDLEVVKTGDVALGGPYAYNITATNNGPDDQTGVEVTDVLPAEIFYVGDSCGDDFADGVWSIGNLANGQTVECDLFVELVDNASCVEVENTATITGDLIDNPANSTSTTSNGGGNVVGDPGFEGGTPNGTWTEASTNFGTPICDLGACGNGTGTGPFMGDFWAWFGGIAAFEEGSVSQSVTIGTGASDLSFWIEQIVCADGTDFIEVLIDGTQVWSTTGADPSCGVLGYRQETVDISAFADGGSHTLEFHSVVNGGGTTNFFIDEVSLDSPPDCPGDVVFPGGGGDPVIEVPTLNTLGLVLLVLLLGIGAAVQLRRRA